MNYNYPTTMYESIFAQMYVILVEKYRNDANEIKPGSNTKVTDKHAAEYSNTVCLGLNNLCVMHELLIQQYSQNYS